MKKHIAYSLFSVVCLTFYSCSSGPEGTTSPEKHALSAKIDSLEKRMKDPNTLEFDKDLALQGIAAYQDFVKLYPEDSLCAEYLFLMSRLCKETGDFGKAMESLKQICKSYPEYPKIPECLFLQGFYYQELFKDTLSAKEYYRQMISEYPDHPFADDAEAMMSLFGKTEEQIMKEFEEKAAAEKNK